jgi:hypothetical protein
MTAAKPYRRIVGKLCSGNCGGAILPPDAEIATVGAMKIRNSNNKNQGGLILNWRFLNLSLLNSGILGENLVTIFQLVIYQ